MENDACNVIYLDRRAREERAWTRDNLPNDRQVAAGHRATRSASSRAAITPPDEVERNVRSLLAVFHTVTVYRSCAPCIAAIERSGPDGSSPKPVMVLVSIPPGEDFSSSQSRGPARNTLRSPSPRTPVSPEHTAQDPENPHGMEFLVHLAYKVRIQTLGPQIIPIVVRSTTEPTEGIPTFDSAMGQGPSTTGHEHISVVPYYDAGAVDVLVSPISVDRASSLPAHVYRMHAERRRRQSSPVSNHSKKTSWVGTKEDKPYTQVKEVMVCELMDHIVNPDRDELPIDPALLQVDPKRHSTIAEAFGSWHFSAHDFADDELVYGALLALQHALKLPGLDKWRMRDDELVIFLLATRRVYNSSVLYHNFRHACDVLQATFCFLILIGALPPFPERPKVHILGTGDPDRPAHVTSTPLESLIDPLHSLILLISAIGHDVGHPGVNNAFLVAVNAPLAQLYNDRSVLESFHCAAYSQILRRYWKSAFDDRLIRKLMITTILATDMGLHGDYMSRMNGLRNRLQDDASEVHRWDDAAKENERELLLCLLIKCADICNVAREHEVSAKWATILIDEFFAQGQIERDSKIPSALFGGPPDPNNALQKAQSQIGFMSIFARPLFSGLAALLPGLQIAVDEMDANKATWQRMIDEETTATSSPKARFEHATPDTHSTETDALYDTADESPRLFNTQIFDEDRGRNRDAREPVIGPEITKDRSKPRLASIHLRPVDFAEARRASEAQALAVPERMEVRRSSLGPTVLPVLPALPAAAKSGGKTGRVWHGPWTENRPG